MRTPLLVIFAAAGLTPNVNADWTAVNLTPAGCWDAAVYAVTPTAQFGSSRLGVVPDTPQALVWHGSQTGWTSFGVGPGNGSHIYAASDQYQAGYFNGHASLWQGTPQSRVDLNPPGDQLSYAKAVSGVFQFGYVYPTSVLPSRAAMWSGSAASYVDLNPPGSQGSAINSAWENQQGGGATYAGLGRAGIWTGTAQSFVDIHPGPLYSESYINGMAQGEQVGVAISAASTFAHAALWRGTVQSFVDLNPLGIGSSALFATIGGVEVGNIYTGVNSAGIWFGTAASFVNLGSLLPAGYSDSRATSIATDGINYYVGGYATSPTTGYSEAFLWTGTVPAPSSLTLLFGAGLLAARRRR